MGGDLCGNACAEPGGRDRLLWGDDDDAADEDEDEDEDDEMQTMSMISLVDNDSIQRKEGGLSEVMLLLQDDKRYGYLD